MRRTTTLVMTVALLMVALSGAAMAAVAVDEATAGGDLLKGTSKANTIHGLGGNDAIYGLAGDDFLYGDSGHDGLYGGPGSDTVRGGSGDDRAEERKVFGGEGNDTLYGDAGEDALYGGPGSDTVYSVGDGEGDYVDCGSGTDKVKKGADQNQDRFVDCERFVNLN